MSSPSMGCVILGGNLGADNSYATHTRRWSDEVPRDCQRSERWGGGGLVIQS